MLALLYVVFLPGILCRTLQFYIEPTQKVVPTYVQQLVEGSIQRIQQGSRLRASVSLIYDGGYYILVDTSAATDLKGKETMLRGIASRNIVPGEVQLVVHTTTDPDHNGQANFFPNARHIFGSYEYTDDTFISTELKTNAKMQLSKNVELWNTPGHTSQDISVIVHNVPCCGTVAVSGDLFYDEEDARNGTNWYSEAWNPLIGKLNRDKVICGADYIIPGHGKLFKITEEMKTAAACGSISPEDLEELTGDYNKKREMPTVSFSYTWPTTTSPMPTVPTTTVPPTTTTPFFITVEHLPEGAPQILNSPQIQNILKSVNEALPYVMETAIPSAVSQLETKVKKAQQSRENILAPVVESAAMQMSNLLRIDKPEEINTAYPFTAYWQKAFNKLANDIPNLQKALNSDNVEQWKEKVRTYRHPAMDTVFQLFNSAYLSPPKVAQKQG